MSKAPISHIHPNCRYTILPIIIEDEDIRSSYNDGIINNKEWLKADFLDQEKFETYVKKHLKEYGDISAEEYLDKAIQLLAADVDDNRAGFISKDGFIFKYDKEENDFARGRHDGKISTLFKPYKKIEYWKKQIKQFANKEE